jgi:hypothetical protein
MQAVNGAKEAPSMISNIQRLKAAVAIALADSKFMRDNSKVDKAVDALTPKSTITATFKRLQGNGNSDFLVKKDEGQLGYTEQTRADKIKEYVHDRFKSYMEDPKTSEEATKLFNAEYPPVAATSSDAVPADGVADVEEEAA